MKQGYDYLIVGLGNPGPTYENTRHNIGFEILDTLANQYDTSITQFKFQGLYQGLTIAGKKVILLKPQTFMNLSGESVVACGNYFSIPMENIIVIYDDISLPVGRQRIRVKGSHGGHNGIRHILSCFEHDNLLRIKIGVGNKPHPHYPLDKWVLSPFTSQEQKILKDTKKNCIQIITYLLEDKLQQAMNEFNS